MRARQLPVPAAARFPGAFRANACATNPHGHSGTELLSTSARQKMVVCVMPCALPQVTYLPVQQNGLVDLQQLEDAFRPETAIVSVMMVNNEIGELFPPVVRKH